MMIGIVVNFSEQHKARVHQSFLKLADFDHFEIRGPDRTGGWSWKCWRSPAVLRGRMAYREKGRYDDAHGQNKKGPGRQHKPPDDR